MSWCFHDAGIYDRLDGLSGKAGCENWRRWAVSKGLWSTKPKAGSIVLYDWNPAETDGADHIGIVESVFDGGIVAVEGNTSANGSQINGGYVMRKTRYNSKIMGYIHIDTVAPSPNPNPVIGFERIHGVDRYNTSKATANLFNGRQNGYVLVNGSSFADGLSASYLAQQKKCSVLLTSAGALNDTVKYITEREPNTIYIIGGEIPSEAEKKLARYNPVRLAGATRYETNLAVLNECDTPNKQLIVVSGQNYPDGICASSINRPVLLVNKELKDYQIEWIQSRGLDRFYVFGGEGAVSEAVVSRLNKLGVATRYAGDNRYATSKSIARTFYPYANAVVLVSGKSFADGLSASNVGNFPIVLCDPNNTIEARRYISGLSIKKAVVIGGKGALSDETADWALTRLESAQEGKA